MIAWVPSIPFLEKQQSIFKKRLEGTGQWLLENETFQQWETSSRSELLWVHGKQGSGKSYLAARVIQYLKDSNEKAYEQRIDGNNTAALAYVYSDSLDTNTIDPSKLIGSILNQLCHLLPHPEIEQSLESLFDRQTEPPTRQDMQGAILSIMAKFPQTFIVVDGLDECHKLQDDQFEELCEFISSLAQPNSSSSIAKGVQPKTISPIAKIVVFSRPEYLEIKKAFRDCPIIQVDAGENDDDIKEFIAREFSSKDLLIKKTPDLLKEVEGSLLSGADGMFLWVDLLVKTLCGSRTSKELRAKLKNLPHGLEEAYSESLRRVLKQEEFVRTRALKILLWTTNAKRALSQDELKEALAIEPGMTELDDDNENKIHRDDGFAADCGDLVYVANGQYHLLHSSLKDYLIKMLPMSGSNPPAEYIIMQKDAARILAETCLTYPNFDSFRIGPVDSVQDLTKMFEEHPFLRYAASYWGRHVVEAKNSDFLELAKTFLSSDGARELSMQVFMQQQGAGVFPHPGRTTPLHFLSIFNLVDIARRFPDAPMMKAERNGFNYTPLDYALIENSREVCTWILEDISNLTPAMEPVHSRRTPIHMAAGNNWGDVIERLISLKFDPEAKCGDLGQTPLHVSALEGSESAMIALLKANVHVNLTDNEGTTPLIDATSTNHPRLVTLLLEAGADVNVLGYNSTAALHQAANNGELSIAKALFEKGAKVDPVAGEEWDFSTPLHLAAENGHLEVVELLIEKGADVNKRRSEGNTALLLTCSSGSLACLERLIKGNARIDARNDTKQTCFHLAAMNGYSDILETLVQKRPDPNLINAVDENGETPLHSTIRNGKRAEAKFLLEHGALTNKTDNGGNSVLQVAITEGENEIGGLLVDKYKVDVRQKGALGSPALHYAAYFGRCDFIPVLLHADADPNAVNENLDTALHFAAGTNELKFIKEILEAMPTLDLAPKNEIGETPLHVAALRGYSELVDFLVQQRSSLMQIRNNNLNLPLHLASWEGHLEIIKLLLNHENVNTQGFSGRTALYGASCGGHALLVRYLLEHGADPNILDDYLQGPLYASLENKHVDVAFILFDNSANPKIPNKYGLTALHKAADLGNEQLVRKLLNSECNGLCASKLGWTPFMSAVYSRKLEVVDALLEHNFNGTAIPDSGGETCIHVAAETGSVEMLNKLTAGNKQIALALDSIGCNALDLAAGAGQTNMIKPLRDLGLDLNGPKDCWRRPLGTAAAAGYYRFVCQLIDLGVDVNQRLGPMDSSPLLIATSNRRPLIAERLVEAGADPTYRDDFGLCSLDYAFEDALVWEKMGDARDHYSPIALQKRIPTLRKAVTKCVKMILALPRKQNPKTEFERLTCVANLAGTLLQIRSEQSHEHARMCFIELASPPEFRYFYYTWSCDVCLQSPLYGTRYVCGYHTSRSYTLCSLCYSDYLEGDGTPKSAPQGLKMLWKLENDLQPIREIGEVFVLYGGAFIYRCCGCRVAIAEWVEEKLKAYEEWEKTYNKTGRFDDYRRPGQIFLKIAIKVRKLVEDEEKEGRNSLENEMSMIEEELAELYREHKPDKEMRRFICSGHEYMEVRDKSTIEDVDKKCFGADGKLTTEWLSSLLEIYKDGDIETEAGEHVEGNNLPICRESPEPVSDRADESALVDQMALLTLELTNEPMEIAATNTAASTVGSEGPSSQAVPTVPPELESLETTQPNAEFKAEDQGGIEPDGKTDSSTNHGPLRNEIDSVIKPSAVAGKAPGILFSSSPNRELLFDIRQLLLGEMVEVVEAVKATKAAKEAAMTGDQGQQLSDSEDASSERKGHVNITSEQAENERQDHQDQDAHQIRQEDNIKESESNPDHDEILDVKKKDSEKLDEEDNLALMEREIAWRFAQVILYGSVEDSLIEIFVCGKDDSGEQEKVTAVDIKEDRESSTEAEGERQLPIDMKDPEHAEKRELALGQTLREAANDQIAEIKNELGDKEGKDEERNEEGLT